LGPNIWQCLWPIVLGNSICESGDDPTTLRLCRWGL